MACEVFVIFTAVKHREIPCDYLKGILNGFDNHKKTSKKVYEVKFFGMQKYVYFESVFNTLYTEKKIINFG